MKKYYCDHCGMDLGSEPANRLALLKPGQSVITCDTFHFCDKCREEFFGWLNNKPAEQEKPTKQKHAKKMLPTWATIKQLAAIFGQSERRMNRLMARTGASRRKAKEGPNWWYEYQITKETYDYLTSKLDCK